MSGLRNHGTCKLEMILSVWCSNGTLLHSSASSATLGIYFRQPILSTAPTLRGSEKKWNLFIQQPSQSCHPSIKMLVKSSRTPFLASCVDIRPPKLWFCKRQKCLISNAEKSQSRRIVVVKIPRFASHEGRGEDFKDANLCSPRCNMQVAPIARS